MPSAVAPPAFTAHTASAPGGFAQFAIVAVAILAMSSALAVVLAGASDPRKPRAVLFSPWTAGEQAIAATLRAGHRPLRSGVAGNVVIVAPRLGEEPVSPWPAGAWLMLNLDGLFGCLDPQPEAA